MSGRTIINFGPSDIVDLQISYKNNKAFIIALPDTEDEDANLDLTGSEFTCEIYGINNKHVFTINGLVNLEDNTASIFFTTPFWNKISLSQFYTYQINRAVGAELLTIMSGNLNCGILQASASSSPINTDTTCKCGKVVIIGCGTYKVNVSGIGPTGAQGSDAASVRMETIFVEDGTTVVTDDKLIGSQLFPNIWFEQSTIRFTANNITWDGTAGTLDFSGYGALPEGYLDFIIKD